MDTPPPNESKESPPSDVDIRLIDMVLDLSVAVASLGRAVNTLALFAPREFTSDLEAAGKKASDVVQSVQNGIREIIAKHG